MKIDGKDFKSYNLDNEYTIKRRMAFLNNTIPEFLYLEKLVSDEKIKKDDEYKSINLIKNIQESNIRSLIKIKELNDKYFFVSFLDLLCLWCYI